MKKQKLLEKILAGSKNIRFEEFIGLVEGFGFTLARVRGSHYIFEHRSVPERLNLQEHKGQVKPYPIRQFLQLVEQHQLRLEE